MDKKVRLQITDVIDSVSANPQLIDVSGGTRTGTSVTIYPPFYFKTYSVVTPQQASLYLGAYDISSTTIPSNRCMPGLSTSNPHYLENILSTPLTVGKTYLLSFALTNMRTDLGYTGKLGLRKLEEFLVTLGCLQTDIIVKLL